MEKNASRKLADASEICASSFALWAFTGEPQGRQKEENTPLARKSFFFFPGEHLAAGMVMLL